MPRRRAKPPSQTWRAFLRNHMHCAVGIDFFVVPTATFKLLYVFVVLDHARRRIVHVNVTDQPCARWTAQQVIEAFPYDTARRYQHRDRDSIFGNYFNARIRRMGIEQVLSASRSPWQNPYVERVIGSIRCECTDHLIITGERHLRQILRLYVDYYNADRTHDSLGKDAPDTRAAQSGESGIVIAMARVGGLHHRYQRLAA
jgi:transposase InsO family protein